VAPAAGGGKRDYAGTMNARSSANKGTAVRRIARDLVAIMLVWWAAVGVPAHEQRQQPPRLIVTNYTGAVITVSAIVNGVAQGRGRITPGASVPIVQVNNGDRFKAEWQGQSRTKDVELRYDPTYGGLQDLWTVQ
jgi:hypothetical protein